MRNLFNEMNASAEKDRDSVIRKENQEFENERVKFVMNRLGLSAQLREIGRIWEDRCGRFEYRFAAFNEVFPSFPFLLGSSVLRGVEVIKNGRIVHTTPQDYAVHRDTRSVVPSCFKDFAGVPFVAAYATLSDQLAGDAAARSICLVFRRHGFLHGMCVHDDQSEQYWSEGLSWVYKIPKTGKRLYVQPFQHLIDDIHNNGRGWRP